MKFQASKRVLIGVGLVVLAAVLSIGLYLLIPRYRDARAENALMAAVTSNKDAAAAYARLVKDEDLKKDPASPQGYIAIGNEWGLIADLLKNSRARQKSIAEYEKGSAIFGKKNIILVLNAGMAYRAAGEFEKAEAKYRQAIEIDPGNQEAYEGLIDLYQLDMKKSSAEIIDVFKLAMDRLVDNGVITQRLAEYLSSIGRYKDALQYYEFLAKRYPQQFNPVIADLKQKMAASSTK